MARKYAGFRNKALQSRIYDIIEASGHAGMTSKEMGQRFNPVTEAHHGDVSGAMTMLAREQRLGMLTEKRAGCHVYVVVSDIAGRKCRQPGNGMPSKDEYLREKDKADAFLGFFEHWMAVDHNGSKFGTDKTVAERNHRLFFEALREAYVEAGGVIE